MKKYLLLVVCSAVFALAEAQCPEPQIIDSVIITGNLGMRALCPELPCLTVDYVIVTNDTASFYLIKDGSLLGSPQQLGNYTVGSVISINGVINKKMDYDNQEYYELVIISILDDNSSTKQINYTDGFQQQGYYLIFGESIPRIINFYFVTGLKICSIESAEKEIKPSLFLKQKGVYIIEVTENGNKYSGYYINF